MMGQRTTVIMRQKKQMLMDLMMKMMSVIRVQVKDRVDIMYCNTHVQWYIVDPFSLHISFDVEPHLAELDKNITTTSFHYHNVRTLEL